MNGKRAQTASGVTGLIYYPVYVREFVFLSDSLVSLIRSYSRVSVSRIIPSKRPSEQEPQFIYRFFLFI